ncbi:uncharacterized protein [Cicer arietinum]|uniref:Uncharacterized protein LOC101515010 n=1 Tax=Cicer arietinum TaxID=3827 RepID=A0A1S2Y196_CICAR|nr:uncharacterized protein LOC101515010 [Cicer arietinum]
MWRIIKDGDFIPRIDQTDATFVEKKEANWTIDEKSKVLINSKSQLFLSCALSKEEGERVDECDTARKVWGTLQTHHEGTSHVKETRIDIGIRKFKIFEINEGETIDKMYSKFTTIVNEMRYLGKAYSVQDMEDKLVKKSKIISLKASQNSPSIQQANEKSDSEENQEHVDEEISLSQERYKE